MGGGASQATHFSAGYKRRLDWLTDQNVQTVTTSGTYRIFAYDVVNAPTGIHALKIRKDNAKDYWIEFRQLFRRFRLWQTARSCAGILPSKIRDKRNCWI
jgi:hypothetical protein